MPQITLEAIQAKQTELAAMIQQLTLQAQQSRTVHISEESIVLQPAEHYAGAVLDANGEHLHHLVLLAAQPDKELNWQDACDWAKSVGGELPDRQEQALLYANCKQHLKPEWHWSSVTYEDDASYAWSCDFGLGTQDRSRKSYEGSAVAVRRV